MREALLKHLLCIQDTNKVLAISRIMVAWQPLGLAMGTYDMCNRYLQQRQQFGSPLAAFQVVTVHAPCIPASDDALLLHSRQ